jgi:hypothetical protein
MEHAGQGKKRAKLVAAAAVLAAALAHVGLAGSCNCCDINLLRRVDINQGFDYYDALYMCELDDANSTASGALVYHQSPENKENYYYKQDYTGGECILPSLTDDEKQEIADWSGAPYSVDNLGEVYNCDEMEPQPKPPASPPSVRFTFQRCLARVCIMRSRPSHALLPTCSKCRRHLYESTHAYYTSCSTSSFIAVLHSLFLRRVNHHARHHKTLLRMYVFSCPLFTEHFNDLFVQLLQAPPPFAPPKVVKN